MTNLSNIADLNEENNNNNNESKVSTSTTSVRVRTPKRILHFSDGTMEEYSDEENGKDVTDHNSGKNDKQVDVKRLTWGPWMIHRALQQTGNRILAACDYVGEAIAAFLGITTPKYSYEIEQFKKMQEEHAKALKEEKEVGGWMENVNAPVIVEKETITTQKHVQRF